MIPISTTRFAIRASYLFVAYMALTGCGGANRSLSAVPSSQGAGSLIVTIRWPKKGRLIPAATAFIFLNVVNTADNSLVTSTHVAPSGQPTTTTTINNLPVGNLTLTAIAEDSNGHAVSQGSKPFTTQIGTPAKVPIDLTTTIDHLGIAPTNPTIEVGSTLQLTASGVNTLDQMVLLTPGKLTWQPTTPTDATFATVDTNGNVTGVAVGNANITVTDTESGKRGSVTVAVTSALSGTWVGNYTWAGSEAGKVSIAITVNADGTASASIFYTPANLFPPNTVTATGTVDGLTINLQYPFVDTQGNPGTSYLRLTASGNTMTGQGVDEEPPNTPPDFSTNVITYHLTKQ